MAVPSNLFQTSHLVPSTWALLFPVNFGRPRAALSTIICGRRLDNIGSGRRCSGHWKKMELQLFWNYFLVSLKKKNKD
jgi:hypothetical protein